MTPDDIAQAAEALFAAELLNQQIGLLSIQHPGMTLDDAYAVQDAFVAAKLAAGRHRIGWKIGLTSRAMQQALGIETPDSGVLLDDMMFANKAEVPQGRFIGPRVEAEIAFIMKSDLSGDVSAVQVLEATEAVAPALEILDTRILRSDPETGKARAVVDTVADNAANAGIVLGDERHAPADADLRWTGAIVSAGGEIEETGLAAGVLGDPAISVAWLVQRLHQYGAGLKAGDIVLSGSFIRPIECPPGTSINADFGQFGNVSVNFL